MLTVCFFVTHGAKLERPQPQDASRAAKRADRDNGLPASGVAGIGAPTAEADRQCPALQRELMREILTAARAARAPGFRDALRVGRARTAVRPRPAAELDARSCSRTSSIRGWIEFCARAARDGEELPIPRIRNEAQFLDARQLGSPDEPPTRYRLTEKGRAH